MELAVHRKIIRADLFVSHEFSTSSVTDTGCTGHYRLRASTISVDASLDMEINHLQETFRHNAYSNHNAMRTLCSETQKKIAGVATVPYEQASREIQY